MAGAQAAVQGHRVSGANASVVADDEQGCMLQEYKWLIT